MHNIKNKMNDLMFHVYAVKTRQFRKPFIL